MATFIEAALGDESHIDREYYDASHHGLAWTLVYEMLHAIVLIFSFYGMIHFEVKFISIHRHAKHLVRAASYLMIGHSWFLCLKFALIFVTLYLFMYHLEYYGIAMNQFNCTLTNRGPINRLIQHQWDTVDRTTKVNRVFKRFRIYRVVKWNYIAFEPGWFQGLVPMVDWLGGPFAWLGYRAVLVFGFYSVAYLILLAVFPLELYVENHSFNHIRFVLNDTNCLKELYERRQLYLCYANASIGCDARPKLSDGHDGRLRHAKPKTVGLQASMGAMRAKQSPAQRKTLARPMARAPMPPRRSSRVRPLRLASSFQELSQASGNNLLELGINGLLTLEDRPLRLIRPTSMLLKSPSASSGASATQQQQQQKEIECRRQENIEVANENLKKFLPHVRSEAWFKVSMILYPIFIFFYFAVLLLIIGSISWQTITQVFDLSSACSSLFGVHLFDPASHLTESSISYELLYTTVALSISSSFYCSFYFSTILELFVWELELNQQLNVCMQNICLESREQLRQIKRELPTTAHEHLDWEFNEFGGLARIWYHIQLQFTATASICNRRRQAWAMRLLSKRETLFRATYINFNLFLDEYRATRHLNEKILVRTTQIAIAFAFLVSISHLQFQRSVMRVSTLLGASQLILNLYLWSAALINTMANRIVNKMQKLHALCYKHRRPDLAKIYARYVGQYGFKIDDFAYVMFNEKITWRNIFEFNGKVISAYMFTLK